MSPIVVGCVVAVFLFVAVHDLYVLWVTRQSNRRY